MAERVERIGEVEERLDAQQIGDHRLVEIVGGERRGGELQRGERAVHQDQHARRPGRSCACRSCSSRTSELAKPQPLNRSRKVSTTPVIATSP